jgi:hypothetical protein
MSTPEPSPLYSSLLSATQIAYNLLPAVPQATGMFLDPKEEAPLVDRAPSDIFFTIKIIRYRTGRRTQSQSYCVHKRKTTARQ